MYPNSRVTGDPTHLRLCGWLIDQRGRHDGRPSGGKGVQDHLPLREQRTIEGHAVCAGFLYNGVTEYVGATGDEGLREAVLAITTTSLSGPRPTVTKRCSPSSR